TLERFRMATTAHASAHGLLRHAVMRGIPAATAADWLGVAVRDLDRPGRLPAARVVDAWVRLRDELADPAVAARAARGWTLADWGLFGFHVAAAPTVRAALSAVARCIGLITERGSWRIIERDDVVDCVWSWSGSQTLAHALSNEVMVSAFVRGVRELTAAPPLCVHFTHRAPPVRAEHEALLECQVRFGKPAATVVVPRAQLDIVPRSANPQLHDFLGGLASRELAALAPTDVRDRTARLLAHRLRDDTELPALPEAARNLGMSDRSLRRRLAEEGTSFRALRTAAQLDRAAALLASSQRSISEIALACGFADASAFGRAWRRSRSEPPSRSRAVAR
ncbi:MAG TPA: AraC family transcriptional regulator ligand-binding domain-containing protein, partial [Kofleriaceae bacterium]|nr:AraC family transcriptional regulator ligand-binding domain-containing protein [Kofleriaceae bacterium]